MRQERRADRHQKGINREDLENRLAVRRIEVEENILAMAGLESRVMDVERMSAHL